MKKLKQLLLLFLTMFKIGLFTFGGGYAMIAIIQREVVEKKKYIDQEEFLNMVAIAESTPGPIAINSATYIGYKVSGFLGSLFCTIGVVLPSFIIIFCISLFFEQFIALEYVNYAFKGIQVCVAFLILKAGITMFMGLEKNIFNIILMIISTCCLILLTLFSIDFSTVFYILIGGGIGLVLYLISYVIDKKKNKNKAINPCENSSPEEKNGGEE